MEVVRQEIYRHIPVYPVAGLGQVVDTLIKNQQDYPFEDMEAVIATVFARLAAHRFVGLQAMPGQATQGYAVQFAQNHPTSSPEPTVKPATAVAKTVLIGDLIESSGRDAALERIDLLLKQLYRRIFDKIIESAAIRGKLDASDFNGFVMDICRASYEIHQQTSRGMGNTVIVSPDIADFLEEHTHLRPEKWSDKITSMGSMHSMNFYRYLDMDEQVIVARVGNTEVDHGLLYMPYIVHKQTKYVIEAVEAWRVVDGANFAILSKNA